MTGLDYFVIGLTGLSLLFGLLKGFVRSLLGLIAMLAGLFLAAIWYPRVAPVIRYWVNGDVTAQLIAFLLIFIAVLLTGVGLGRAIRSGLVKAHLGWVDHLVGGAFGLARGWFICSVLYVGLTAFPTHLEMVAQARLGPYLVEGAEILTHVTSKNLRGRFLEGYQRLRSGWEEFRQGSKS